jgi:uncharacterized membrane protein YraQ (UPF0718 family)
MGKNGRNSSMIISTLIMGIIALILFVMGYFRGEGQHIAGIKSAVSMIIEIIPLLIFAFVVAGMVQVLISQEIIGRWIGAESGIRGIIIRAVAGGVCPGGPFVSLPIAAGLLRSGAGTGTMVAFITGWSVYAVGRLLMEVGILGWKFTFVRLVSTAFLPVLAGLIAQVLFGGSQSG